MANVKWVLITKKNSEAQVSLFIRAVRALAVHTQDTELDEASEKKPEIWSCTVAVHVRLRIMTHTTQSHQSG